LELAPGYSLYNWLDDKLVSRDETSFILTVATLMPFLSETPPSITGRSQEVEVRVRGDSADCYAAAFVLNMLLVSFAVGVWGASTISADVSELESGGSITARSTTLRNISRITHYDVHNAWITNRRIASISGMDQLWEERATLFPDLIFCPSVELQLNSVAPTDPHFRRIIMKLFELQKYFKNWSAGGFNPKAFAKCNPTSGQTLNHRDYGPKYLFATPAGSTAVCGWHVYITPGAWRIYFCPDAASRNGIIGHVGVKLPGVKFGVVG
jgi:hypothetical protein